MYNVEVQLRVVFLESQSIEFLKCPATDCDCLMCWLLQALNLHGKLPLEFISQALLQPM